MTSFVEKLIVYYDRCSSSRIAVRIKRDFKENCVIIFEAFVEDVVIDEIGEICSWTSRFSHICSLSSWQQYLNRRYSSKRFVKDKEIYFYNLKESIYE